MRGFCVMAMLAGWMIVQLPAAMAKPIRFELAAGFHQADPLFGQQLPALIAKLEAARISQMRLRISRKAMGASAAQMIDLMKLGSIDGALIDPTSLGFRPAIAQILGGVPFGPSATQIVTWSATPGGREGLRSGFAQIGTHPILCGHAERHSGVFARRAFVWPAQSHLLTVHAENLGGEIYQGLGFLTRQLPGADLYMAYATGVADLLVTRNTAMAARAGFGQVSDYFYYPSWEQNSAFALLLISLKAWQAFPGDARSSIESACNALNQNAGDSRIEATLNDIRQQGTGNTIIAPWPAEFTADAHRQWTKSAEKLLLSHPVLNEAFKALKIPARPAAPIAR